MGDSETSSSPFKMSNRTSHSYLEPLLANGENALPDGPTPNWSKPSTADLLEERFYFSSSISSSTQFLWPNTLEVTGITCARIIIANNFYRNNFGDLLEVLDLMRECRYITVRVWRRPSYQL